MARLIANMVGKNEGSRFLPEVLERLSKQVDFIVFTDDASTDDTAEIAHSYGAYVYKSDESLFAVHEGQLRNQAWQNLSIHASLGDWILAIDCDEMMYETTYKLEDLLRSPKWGVMNITFYHMWNPTHYRVDKLWKPTPSSRLFRYVPNGSIRDRKLACGAEPSYVVDLMRAGKYFADSGLVMKHLGYVKDEDKQMKYERYTQLDGGAFHAGDHIKSIIDPNPTLVEWTFG